MEAYINTKKAVERYTDKGSLSFLEVTPAFLKDFESYLFSTGCTAGGIGAYYRTFRALINQAIREGILKQELYPFKNQFNSKGYDMSKLKTSYNPRALSLEDMEKFKNFDIEKYPWLKQTHSIAMFIYYSKGMNFADLCHLKWENIYERLNYTRRKTGGNFSIKLSKQIEDIIEQYKGNNPFYVFPFLTEYHATEKQKRYRIGKCRKKFNSDLKEICKILEIPVNMTSYVLRHTYATTLKRKGASIALISQSMGHKNIEVTNHYLKSFENEEIDKLDELL